MAIRELGLAAAPSSCQMAAQNQSIVQETLDYTSALVPVMSQQADRYRAQGRARQFSSGAPSSLRLMVLPYLSDEQIDAGDQGQ
jgi:hypothetical protein